MSTTGLFIASNGGTLTIANGNFRNEITGTIKVDSQFVRNSAATFVNVGRICGDGTFIDQSMGGFLNQGTLAPGKEIGPITIEGDYRQDLGGLLEIEIVSATEFDQLLCDGDVELDGLLEIKLTDGFIPSPSDQFVIAEANTIDGRFKQFPLGSERVNIIDDRVKFVGGQFDIVYESNTVTLTNFQPLFNNPANIDVVIGGSFEPQMGDEKLAPRCASVFVENHDSELSENLGFGKGSWKTYYSESQPFSDSLWYNLEGSVDLVDSSVANISASDGNNFVDLIGTPRDAESTIGLLNQNLNTDTSLHYVVQFDISSNQANGNSGDRFFSFSWGGQQLANESAPPQGEYDSFTFVEPVSDAVTQIGFGAISNPKVDEGLFGVVLDNVRAFEIQAMDDSTVISEDAIASLIRDNLLENDSAVTGIITATIDNCSKNLTLERCGEILNDGFPGGNVTWQPIGDQSFDFLASGEFAFIEIDYTTENSCSVRAEWSRWSF